MFNGGGWSYIHALPVARMREGFRFERESPVRKWRYPVDSQKEKSHPPLNLWRLFLATTLMCCVIIFGKGAVRVN